MSLPAVCIRRPVLAWMMNLVLILLGLVALQGLPVRELPDIDPPIVNVTTVYPGANSAVVETEVTERLEEVINGVEGIKTLTSESRNQVSNITVEFDLSRPIEVAAQDIRDRVSRVRGGLPEDILEPVVSKQDADAQPVMWVALYSDRLSTLDLTAVAEERVKNRLETISGVSSVILGGAKRYAIRLRLDPDRMAAHGVTILDVRTALREQNVELPSGAVESQDRQMAIQTRTGLTRPDQFNQIVVRQDGDRLVRLADIGEATSGVEDEISVARYNSQPAMGLGVVRQSKANTIEVADAIKATMAELAPNLPAGVEWFVAYDESVYVEKAIGEVWITLGIAFLLVVVIIWLFLGDARSTLVPAIAIPVSVAATFGVLALFGFSVNILTMLALVLAIGLVVDDSIVVLENIYRHIENGLAPMEASFKAMGEIVFAVITTTISLVAVFVPLAFQKSITGRLLMEFAISLSGAVIISSFVALTLTPVVASRLLKAKSKTAKPPGPWERFLNRLSAGYGRWLDRSLARPGLVLFIGLIAVGGGLWCASLLEQDFLPEEDKGRLLCFIIAPEGSTSAYTDRMLRQTEAIVADVPEISGYFSAVALAFAGPGNPAQGLIFVRLDEDRERSLQDILKGPTGMGARLFTEVEGALSIPIVPKAIGRGFGQPFQLVLKNQNLQELDQFAQSFSQTLRSEGYLANVRPSFALDKPELELSVDRDRAAAMGVSVEDIARTLQLLFGGQDLSKVNIAGKEYDVIAQLDAPFRADPDDVDRLVVRSKNGSLVRLGEVVQRRVTAGPNAISHYNRRRSVTIEATPVNVPMGVAVKKTEALLDAELPPGFDVQWAGEAKDLKETGLETLFVVLLALIIVYMVLAAQFESLKDPFTVMLAMPLALLGGAGALWLLGKVNGLGEGLYAKAHYGPEPDSWTSFLDWLVPRIPAMNINLFSLIGGVLLIGLVTKNSILLVEFANQAMDRGLAAKEAMIEAARLRMRPILMTALSTIVGTLPIAIGFGAGAESRRPMGVAVVGGMMSSTLLTLFVIPVVYVMLSSRKKSATKPA